MSEYTDQDRERSQKTLTLVEQSIKQNDERHDDVKKILEKHEVKIDRNKTMITKVLAIGTFVVIPVTAALTAFGKKFIG